MVVLPLSLADAWGTEGCLIRSSVLHMSLGHLLLQRQRPGRVSLGVVYQIEEGLTRSQPTDGPFQMAHCRFGGSLRDRKAMLALSLCCPCQLCRPWSAMWLRVTSHHPFRSCLSSYRKSPWFIVYWRRQGCRREGDGCLLLAMVVQASMREEGRAALRSGGETFAA